jgi:hypothetical protein
MVTSAGLIYELFTLVKVFTSSSGEQSRPA